MSRCRVCHRELTNPEHRALGIGPVCAAKAARHASGSARSASYPRERYARVVAMCQKLADMLSPRYRWTAEDRALIEHWYERALRMEQQTSRRVAA